jgi:tetratricopeptide (TPR) repeat protein
MTTVFVGRDWYIQKAVEVLQELSQASVSDKTRFIYLTGPGGIGKTKLSEQIRHRADLLGIANTPVIDLRATTNRSEISLLSSIAAGLGTNYFQDFSQAVAKYNTSSDIERSIHYEKAINAFIQSITSISESTPVLLIFDTFESIQNTKLASWLLDLTTKLGGRCSVIFAGRNDISHKEEDSVELQVAPFSTLEAEALAKRIFAERRIEYDLDEATIVSIHSLSKGKPILITLAIEWILENAHPEDIISLAIEEFEREMVVHIRTLETLESQAILLMALANRRFNARIMSALSGLASESCESILSILSRFSFIKEWNRDVFFTLHDEMLRLIEQYIALPASFKQQKYELLIDNYYNKEIERTADILERQELIAEKLYYQLQDKHDEAIIEFEKHMQQALDAFNFDFCYLLLSEMDQSALPADVRRIVDINRAEMALRMYQPTEARPILQELLLQDASLYGPEYISRVLEGIGSSIINPCTLVEASPFEALDYFQRALELSSEHGFANRIPGLQYQLANTYSLVGQHTEAENAYKIGLDLARQNGDLKLVTRILDEMGKLYREQQNLEKAFAPLKESMEIKEAMGFDQMLGTSFYYMGNVYRDLDDFETAAQYYREAEARLTAIGDDFKLCELYNDMSWMERLREEYDLASYYLEKSYEIVQKRNFGTEFSEYWHIAYELSMIRGEHNLAYVQLDKALYYARRYPNMYMLLDCLNHAAQRAYAQGRYDDIPQVLEEMYDLERRGCGIRVFTGRALMVYGDAQYDQKRYEAALKTWKDGLTIIALYGNSRTNVELFDDILQQRLNQLEHVLRVGQRDAVAQLRNAWTAHNLSVHFPAILTLCDRVESAQD